MIRPTICFAALAVVRDTETNSISAFNILEGIGATGFPLLLQNATFFVLWEREATDPLHIPASFTVGLAGQVPLITHQITLDFAEHIPRHRSIANLNGLIVPTPGLLRFRLVPEIGTPAEYTVVISAAAPPGVQLAGQEPH